MSLPYRILLVLARTAVERLPHARTLFVQPELLLAVTGDAVSSGNRYIVVGFSTEAQL